MKKVILSALFFSFLISCSSDDAILSDNNEQEITTTSKIKTKSIHTPQYTANVYDVAGSLHNTIKATYDDGYSASTLTGVITSVNTIATSNATFLGISTGYSGVSSNEAQWVVNYCENTSAILAGTSHNSVIKGKLNSFMTLFNGMENDSYDAIYNAVTAFEDTVIGDTSMTTAEKKVVLTATSVARYVTYSYDGNGKPRYWKRIRTAVHGSMAGSDESTGTSVALAVTTGLAITI